MALFRISQLQCYINRLIVKQASHAVLLFTFCLYGRHERDRQFTPLGSQAQHAGKFSRCSSSKWRDAVYGKDVVSVKVDSMLLRSCRGSILCRGSRVAACFDTTDFTRHDYTHYNFTILVVETCRMGDGVQRFRSWNCWRNSWFRHVVRVEK